MVSMDSWLGAFCRNDCAADARIRAALVRAETPGDFMSDEMLPPEPRCHADRRLLWQARFKRSPSAGHFPVERAIEAFIVSVRKRWGPDVRSSSLRSWGC